MTVVRDLGVQLDAKLIMKQHNQSSCQQLRRLRRVRRSAGEGVAKRPVTELVLSRLDYCDAALEGLPESTFRPLQRVQNAAARLTINIKSSDHITPILMRLHLLHIKSRLTYTQYVPPDALYSRKSAA